MQDYEKLGVFYLGKTFNLDTGKPTDELLLYPSKDLTTHAVCVGMTGSGKTGLCLSLLEEAAIDSIPVLAIDPKGDLGNLLLAFPDCKADDFKPWLDPADAARKNVTIEQLADQTAAAWRKGLEEWGQPVERIKRYRDAVDVAIYTPGSTAGLPLTVLRSFKAPPQTLQGEAYRERIASAVSGLLALLNIDADPINSREHILLSNLLDASWKRGEDLEAAGLIRAIQQPPFDKVGFIDLETFFPAKDRFGLAMSLNNLLASPNFAGWMEGEPLDIGALLHTPQGKPRLSIVSIAHLNDSERMFFVTILLNEVLAWVRTQSGTSSLRAILYMDEVFGYFPPTANPPSKTPMLTLLKQARAFGLGVVLATQNPVDLDYKGLSNTGTWFLGRLQTERDKMRVLDGLEGAASSEGKKFNRQAMSEMLARLGNRVFLMNNVHDDRPVVFQTRWALSFLRGPITREQIGTLMASRKSTQPTGGAKTAIASGDRPVLPPGVVEMFLPVRGTKIAGARLAYRPALLGDAKIHFTDTKNGIDAWRPMSLTRLIDGRVPGEVWSEAAELEVDPRDLEDKPESGIRFEELPAEAGRIKSFTSWATDLKQHLYRTQTLELFRCDDLKETSQPDENERDFRVRLTHAAREERDAVTEKLQTKYAPKLASLEEKIRKAMQKVEKEKSQAQQSTFSAAMSFGTSILSALTGRKLASATNISKATSAAKSAGRAMNQRKDVEVAQSDVDALVKQRAELEAEFAEEVERVKEASSPESLRLTPLVVKPKKTEISVERVILVWTPWWAGEGNDFKEAF